MERYCCMLFLFSLIRSLVIMIWIEVGDNVYFIILNLRFYIEIYLICLLVLEK